MKTAFIRLAAEQKELSASGTELKPSLQTVVALR
jgi:hypothetical protein